MDGVYRFFVAIIVIQLFYSFGVTILSHTLSDFPVNNEALTPYTDEQIDITDISGRIESTTQNQLNIPLIDLGALVFYSGNIIVDLMLNFFLAVPSLFTLVVSGFSLFFNVDAFLMTQIKIFLFAVVTIIYFLNMVAFVLNIRSGRTVV